MTFTEIAAEVTEDLGLSSTTATARVGREINIRYKGLVSSLGLKTSKVASNTQPSVAGTNEITFTGLNKILRVVDFTGGVVVSQPTQVAWDEIRELTVPSSNSPVLWAVKRVGSISVVVAFDVAFTSTAVSMRADGFEVTSTLSGSTEPAFPQDFHDILVWGVKADEYMKMEKPTLAVHCEKKAVSRLSELRLYLATNLYLDLRQSGNSDLGNG